jgi:hypothetical protein
MNLLEPLFLKVKTIPNWDKMHLVYPTLPDDVDLNEIIQQLEIENLELAKQMATTPELCTIAALAVAYGENGKISSGLVSSSEYSEEGILKKFWASTVSKNGHLTQRKLVGYNQTRFDLAVILTRSAMLNIPIPRGPIDNRPWGNDVIDLAECRQKFLFYGHQSHKSLTFLAQAYDLDILPAYQTAIQEFNNGQYLTGEDTLSFYESNPYAIEEWVRNDVYWLQQLYGKMKGYFFNG